VAEENMNENDTFRMGDNTFTVSRVVEKPVLFARWSSTAHKAIAIHRETFFALDDRKEKCLIQVYYFPKDTNFGIVPHFP
jgi:hypothetical protein